MKQTTTTTNTLLGGLSARRAWDIEQAYQRLKQAGLAHTKRTTERLLKSMQLSPDELEEDNLQDELDRPPNQPVLTRAIEQARKRCDRVPSAQLHPLPDGTPCLHVNDARGARY